MASKDELRVDLVANDEASKKIDAVADKIEAVEKQSPQVTLEADDQASDEIATVATLADKLDGQTYRAILGPFTRHSGVDYLQGGTLAGVPSAKLREELRRVRQCR